MSPHLLMCLYVHGASYIYYRPSMVSMAFDACQRIDGDTDYGRMIYIYQIIYGQKSEPKPRQTFSLNVHRNSAKSATKNTTNMLIYLPNLPTIWDMFQKKVLPGVHSWWMGKLHSTMHPHCIVQCTEVYVVGILFEIRLSIHLPR